MELVYLVQDDATGTQGAFSTPEKVYEQGLAHIGNPENPVTDCPHKNKVVPATLEEVTKQLEEFMYVEISYGQRLVILESFRID